MKLLLTLLLTGSLDSAFAGKGRSSRASAVLDAHTHLLCSELTAVSRLLGAVEIDTGRVVQGRYADVVKSLVIRRDLQGYGHYFLARSGHQEDPAIKQFKEAGLRYLAVNVGLSSLDNILSTRAIPSSQVSTSYMNPGIEARIIRTNDIGSNILMGDRSVQVRRGAFSPFFSIPQPEVLVLLDPEVLVLGINTWPSASKRVAGLRDSFLDDSQAISDFLKTPMSGNYSTNRGFVSLRGSIPLAAVKAIIFPEPSKLGVQDGLDLEEQRASFVRALDALSTRTKGSEIEQLVIHSRQFPDLNESDHLVEKVKGLDYIDIHLPARVEQIYTTTESLNPNEQAIVSDNIVRALKSGLEAGELLIKPGFWITMLESEISATRNDGVLVEGRIVSVDWDQTQRLPVPLVLNASGDLVPLVIGSTQMKYSDTAASKFYSRVEFRYRTLGVDGVPPGVQTVSPIKLGILRLWSDHVIHNELVKILSGDDRSHLIRYILEIDL